MVQLHVKFMKIVVGSQGLWLELLIWTLCLSALEHARKIDVR